MTGARASRLHESDRTNKRSKKIKIIAMKAFSRSRAHASGDARAPVGRKNQ